LLVEGWDAARHLEQSAYLTHEDKIEILQQVAFEMQQEEAGMAGNMISERRLKHILKQALVDRNIEKPAITAQKIVGALAERDFMLCFIGDAQFAFVHRTFLEYFCAKEYKSHLENAGGAEELLDLFRERWQDDAWHEVFRLICAMVGPELAGRLVAALLSFTTHSEGWQAAFLAADCLSEVRKSGKVESERLALREALLKLLAFQKEFVGDTEIRVRTGAVKRLARGWPDESTYSLLCSQADAEYYAVRDMAVEELSRCWRTDVTREWLLTQAASSNSWRVRQAAVHGLITSWKDEASRKLVLDRIDSDPNNAVRHVALREYIEAWPEYATRDWIIDKAVSHHHPDVRATAISEVTSRFDDQFTRDWALGRISSEENLEVLDSVTTELAYKWPKEFSVTQFIEWAANKEQPIRREAAITAFVRVFGRLDLVEPYVRDEAVRIRKAALKALALRLVPTNSAVREVLSDRARTDEDASVRNFAIAELASVWVDNSTWNLLAEIAYKDSVWRVRQTSIRTMWRNWPTPETQKLLMSRAVDEAEPRLRAEIIGQLLGSENKDVVLELLLDRYFHDADQEVKKAAFKVLRERFAEHPDVIRALK
jgi:HEAT repeats